jgi:hypothetical protein
MTTAAEERMLSASEAGPLLGVSASRITQMARWRGRVISRA